MAPALRDGDISLEPVKLENVKDLLMKYAAGDKFNKTPEAQLEKGLELVKYTWICRAEGKVGGIVVICFLDHMNWWTLDAYKNDEHDNREGDFSYRAGMMAIDWFFKSHD